MIETPKPTKEEVDKISRVFWFECNYGWVLDETDYWTDLSPEDQVKIAELLINPPPQNAAMKRAFAHRERLFSEVPWDE